MQSYCSSQLSVTFDKFHEGIRIEVLQFYNNYYYFRFTTYSSKHPIARVNVSLELLRYRQVPVGVRIFSVCAYYLHPSDARAIFFT